MLELAGSVRSVVLGGCREERMKASRGSSRRRIAPSSVVGGSCVGMSMLSKNTDHQLCVFSDHFMVRSETRRTYPLSSAPRSRPLSP